MKYPPLIALALFAAAGLIHASEAKIQTYEPTGSLPYLSVEESLETFHLPEGFSLEPVLTEPHIMTPVVAVFDGNGRMYVAEMRTYMLDAEATGEQEPVSRVSMHEDTDGDGVMDKHSVFVDDLLLPRMVLPLDDRILINETNTLDIYAYRDTDGDGVADEKTLFYEGGPRGGNMEHQPSGLIWSMDNWIYSTYNGYRLRYNPEGLATKEKISGNGGQWGLCQDDYGKPWFSNAGGEMGPLNFQQPIAYGQFNVADQFPIDFREVFPLVGIPDVQGGTHRFRPDTKTLNHFTATGGQEIYRGDRLPESLRGNFFLPEPVGRMIRRSTVEVRDGITYLDNAHPGSEFLRSTDPYFRPVNMTNAPDGSLYIVDMYHGIVQQGNWTQPGSYLRSVIDEYGLDKNRGRGRVYRLVHDDFEAGSQPRMLDETPIELVAHLEHPNGWWRDTAQKLLIVANDKSIVPELETMARESKSDLARVHAVWTLEGLNALTPEVVREKLKDSAPQVRLAVIRASESLVKVGEESLVKDLIAMAADGAPEVATQALLTARYLNLPEHKELISTTMKSSRSRGVREFGQQMLTGGNKPPAKLTAEQLARYEHGAEIYQSLCFACHGADGAGTKLSEEVTLAPSLVDSAIISGNRELAVKVVLHGLTGPVENKTYPGEMIAMKSNGDAWVADVLSFVRNSFGNQLGFIGEEEVSAIRERAGERATPWTETELLKSTPRVIGGRENWRLTASHNNESRQLKLAVDSDYLSRYSSRGNMAPGMWVQVDLREIQPVDGIVLDAGTSRGDFPRGFRVETSTDAKTWHEAAVGTGETPRLEIDYAPTLARYVKITLTGEHSSHWSIHDLQVTTLPAPPEVDFQGAAKLGDRAAWKLTASHGEKDVALAVDGDPETRYTTGENREPGMWFQVEFPQPTAVAGLILESQKSPNDYPKGYLVELSEDGKEWALAAMGNGSVDSTRIAFPPEKARYLRIKQMGKSRGYWSIHELQVLGAE